MLSYLGCLWSDQILQMLGSQSVYTPALLGGNDFSATITSYSETVDVCDTGSVGGGGKSRGGRRVFHSQCCHEICCGCDYTIIRCDYSDGSRDVSKMKLELTTFLMSTAQGVGRLVSLGRTAQSSTMDVSLSANCPTLVFMSAVNDWRL